MNSVSQNLLLISIGCLAFAAVIFYGLKREKNYKKDQAQKMIQFKSQKVITYNVQIPSDGFKSSKNMNAIDYNQAIEIFESFKFGEYADEAEKGKGSLPSPTLSFVNNYTGEVLWISYVGDTNSGIYVLGTINSKLSVPNESENKEEVKKYLRLLFNNLC